MFLSFQYFCRCDLTVSNTQPHQQEHNNASPQRRLMSFTPAGSTKHCTVADICISFASPELPAPENVRRQYVYICVNVYNKYEASLHGLKHFISGGPTGRLAGVKDFPHADSRMSPTHVLNDLTLLSTSGGAEPESWIRDALSYCPRGYSLSLSPEPWTHPGLDPYVAPCP